MPLGKIGIAKSDPNLRSRIENSSRLYQKGIHSLYPVGMALPLDNVKKPVPDILYLVELAASVELPLGKKLDGKADTILEDELSMALTELVISSTAALADEIAGAAAVDGEAVTNIVLFMTVVTVTIAHTPPSSPPIPAATLVAARPFPSTALPPAVPPGVSLAGTMVMVSVEVDVLVKVVVPSFANIEVAAKFAGAAELTARELAPAAKLPGAAEVSAGAAMFPAAAAVELWMKIVSVVVNVKVL